MIEILVLFAVVLIMLTVAVVGMAMFIKLMCKEIDEINVKLGRHQAYFLYLDSRELDNEKRIDQLEEALDLKEWLDKEKEVRNEND